MAGSKKSSTVAGRAEPPIVGTVDWSSLEAHGTTPILAEALQAARDIEDPGSRSAALVEVMGRLEPHEAAALAEALQAARDIEDPGSRSTALVKVAGRLKALVNTAQIEHSQTEELPETVNRVQACLLKPEPQSFRPEQLKDELVSRLKGLIPALPSAPEEKAKAAFALNRDLNQAFWEELRDELVPLIKPLLQDIPGDYEGKRARAVLVNGLLSTFNLAILIQAGQGRTRLCSVYAVRARESDEKGNLRLLERTASGSSRRSYPIPSLDELQLIETPHQESDAHGQATGRGRRV